jgi:Fe-S-cluster-containing hydrogenase component 2
MPNILQQSYNTGKGKTLENGFIPVSLHFSSGSKTIIKFSNNQEAFGSCLRCHDTPCMKFDENEIIPINFERFPADKNLDVCAAQAFIGIDDNGVPVIDSDSCVFCGVCSSRCPVGAITLNKNIGAVVEDSINTAFIETGKRDISINNKNKKLFELLPYKGSHLIEDDYIIDNVLNRLKITLLKIGDKFPNILSRNLLIGAGINSSISRKGNTNMRMDIIFSDTGFKKNGVAEVEFGQEAILDGPRDIMDALAILISRYNWSLNLTTAIIISDLLPNRRSEYWHIIKDIKNVLDVKVQTVSIFSLMLYNWSRKKASTDLENNVFYIDKDTESYRKIIEMIFDRPLNLDIKDLRPHIEIAK